MAECSTGRREGCVKSHIHANAPLVASVSAGVKHSGATGAFPRETAVSGMSSYGLLSTTQTFQPFERVSVAWIQFQGFLVALNGLVMVSGFHVSLAETVPYIV